MYYTLTGAFRASGALDNRQLEEGMTAVAQVGEFFARGQTCKVVCERGAACSGAAPVHWHFHENTLPMATSEDCK